MHFFVLAKTAHGQTATRIHIFFSVTQNRTIIKFAVRRIPYRPFFRRPIFNAGPINAGPNNAGYKLQRILKRAFFLSISRLSSIDPLKWKVTYQARHTVNLKDRGFF